MILRLETFDSSTWTSKSESDNAFKSSFESKNTKNTLWINPYLTDIMISRMK